MVIFFTMNYHILSSPSFNSLQAEEAAVEYIEKAHPRGLSCSDECEHEDGVPAHCDDGCATIEKCRTRCFPGDICKIEIDTVLSCGECNCAASFEADAPVIESFASNLAHALEKNLRY